MGRKKKKKEGRRRKKKEERRKKKKEGLVSATVPGSPQLVFPSLQHLQCVQQLRVLAHSHHQLSKTKTRFSSLRPVTSLTRTLICPNRVQSSVHGVCGHRERFGCDWSW